MRHGYEPWAEWRARLAARHNAPKFWPSEFGWQKVDREFSDVVLDRTGCV